MTKDSKESLGGMFVFAFLVAIVAFFCWMIFAPHGVEVWQCRNCGRTIRMGAVHLPKAPALTCSGCGETRMVLDRMERPQ